MLSFVNNQIKGLADTFLTGIEADVNPGMEKRQFSKIPFENRKNMLFQIVACNSSNHPPWARRGRYNMWD
jgi:hypothetical protein